MSAADFHIPSRLTYVDILQNRYHEKVQLRIPPAENSALLFASRRI